MNLETWLPALIVLSSLLPGILIFVLKEEDHRLRTGLNLTGAIVKLALGIRHCGLMRILNFPDRSPDNDSSRLLRRARRSSSVSALSKITKRRVA